MVLDIIFLLLLIFGTVLGIKKGLFVELGTILGIILGVWGAITFSERFGVFLGDFINKRYLELTSFIVLFIGIMILTTMISKILTNLFKAINLGGINRLLGAIFGLFKWMLILSVIIIIFDSINSNLNIIKQNYLNESKLFTPLKELGIFIIPKLREVLNV